MPLRLSLIAASLTLCACASTKPGPAPSEIPQPAAVLTVPCPSPDPLPDVATGKELAESLAQWMRFGGCELYKHKALLESWPS